MTELLSSSTRKDINNYCAASKANIENPELDKIIKDVKIQIRKIFQGYKEHIQRLGSFLLEKELVKEEDICSEIKNVLCDEIKEKLVSSDTIERCCPDEWKRKTKPKDIGDPQMRIFERKNQLEQEQETVTSTKRRVTPEGLELEQKYKAADAKVVEEQSKKQEEQFEKIKQQQELVIKQQQIIKDQKQELEKLRMLGEEQLQAQESQSRKENIDLKAQLKKVQEENTRFRIEPDESRKQGQLKVLVDEWTLSNQLLSLRSSGYTKLQIVIENNKYVKIEGVD